MSHQALLFGHSWKPIVAGGAVFDGTNDYMTRGAGLTGAADSKSGILSFWMQFAGGVATYVILDSDTVLGGASNFRFLCTTDGSSPAGVIVQARNSAATAILNIQTDNHAFTSGGSWGHFLCSWDLAATASHIYVNDVTHQTVNIRTNDTIDQTVADWAIGANPDGSQKLNAALAEFYFAPGQFLDFSVESNRRKFITKTLLPMSLGSDGSTPTGTAPLIYQSIAVGGTVSGFATNKGSGGNFTITGALTASTSSPSG